LPVLITPASSPSINLVTQNTSNTFSLVPVVTVYTPRSSNLPEHSTTTSHTIDMDIIMETDQQTCPLPDEKAVSPPKPMSCDEVGEDILQDTYFDHTRPLDSNALDALLNTKFNTGFDDVEDDLPASAVAFENEVRAVQSLREA
jgi:hypothetical protein